MMNEREKSDKVVVPMKPVNKTKDFWSFVAELAEGRTLAKENQRDQAEDREEHGPAPAQADQASQPQETQHSCKRLPSCAPMGGKTMPQAGCPAALDRIRQAARRDKKLQFTNLFHHVYAIDRLRQAYFELLKQAAPGIDGQTWSDYGQELENNLQNLSDRLAKGRYKAPPVKRVYIPKPGGKRRPIGIPTLEDKIVQRAATAVLGAVYEADFKGFSYGFRPGKSAHLALDALAVAIQTKKVNFVLDADIRSFFDTLGHTCLMQFVEHRIADPHLLRLLRKWLNAGVMEAGRRIEQEEGVPQGGSVSPLLANLYLHYALDLWAEQWRKRQAKGDVIIVRYADDFVIGFEHERDARRFLEELKERFGKFNLELHDEKTRIIPFGRHARSKGKKREDGDQQGGSSSGGNADASTADRPARPGKPSTFDFLGFTHSCGQTRKGRFIVLRRTMAKRMRAKLKALKEELARRMHHGIHAMGRWLQSVLRGHVQYFGVPRNSQPLWAFRAHLTRLWKQALNRRSQRRSVTWGRMSRIAKRWLLYPRIVHPYPEERLCVIIQGKSPVR
jgi:group II intron reverse transcriptase/maturase